MPSNRRAPVVSYHDGFLLAQCMDQTDYISS
jgi:hypothetical protein